MWTFYVGFELSKDKIHPNAKKKSSKNKNS